MNNIKDKEQIHFIIKKNQIFIRKKPFFYFNIIIIWTIIIMILFLFVKITIFLISKSLTVKRNILTWIKGEFNKNKNYSREEALTRGRNFLNICLEEKLINNIKFTKLNKPKITVIVPIYNSEQYIKKNIRSIQNQNMKDIEIILVNDASTDNTIKIIEELKKEDYRIELINNERNMGILYSRCIGALNSKGKYIVPLDHDDFFLDEDVLEVIYEEAEKTNIDIISFMDIEIFDLYENITKMKDGFTTNHPDGLIIKQPELSYFPFFINERYNYVDVDIWGKIYRSDIYKKAVNLLGKERYSVYNAFNEDQIALFAICIVSKSYKYLRKYGIFHTFGHQSALGSAKNDHARKMEIFFIEEIFDLSKNENKKYGLFMALSFDFNNLNEDNKLYLEGVLNKILKCQYIEQKLKDQLKNKYSNILFK